MAILVALAGDDQHGYSLMQEIGAQTGEIPGTGSLYAALQRLADEGLIVDAPDRPRGGEDQRRKYFRITKLGRTRARAEVERMLKVVAAAHEKSLISDATLLRVAR
jgi:DNA-binding PadR family transcriptional regulator